MTITNKLIITSLFIFSLVLVAKTISVPSAYAALNCFSGGSCFYTACNSNADCSSSRFVGQQFCQNNNLYQSYVTYTCNNPGSAYSSCTSSKSPRLLQTCNQKCEDNLWYIGCSSTNSTNNINYNFNKVPSERTFWTKKQLILESKFL